jgi:hypothetical protein
LHGVENNKPHLHAKRFIESLPGAIENLYINFATTCHFIAYLLLVNHAACVSSLAKGALRPGD